MTFPSATLRGEQAAAGAMLAISSIALSAALLAGLNGNHVLRQSDAYSQILGILGRNGIQGLRNFLGQPRIYDIPLYQYAVAGLTRLFDADPLVTARLLNIALWAVFLLFSFRIAERAARGAGKYVVFLLATSPLFIHYFSTPLPDLLALTACAAGLWHIDARPPRRRALGLLLLLVGTVIKSPVAFVFAVHHLSRRLPELRRGRERLAFDLLAALSLAAAAVLAELARGAIVDFEPASLFAQDPAWYFGPLGMRAQGDFWATFAWRTAGMPYVNGAFGATLGLVTLATLLALLRSRSLGAGTARELVAAGAAILAGWLVFSNVFRIHDYYQLPTTVFVFLFHAVLLARLEDRLRARTLRASGAAVAAALAALVPVLLLYPPNVGSPADPSERGALGLLFASNQMRDLERTTDLEVVGHLARGLGPVLLVDDGYEPGDRSFGGLIEREFRWVTSEEFRAAGNSLADGYRVVVVRGDTPADPGRLRGFSERVTVGPYLVHLRRDGSRG